MPTAEIQSSNRFLNTITEEASTADASNLLRNFATLLLKIVDDTHVLRLKRCLARRSARSRYESWQTGEARKIAFIVHNRRRLFYILKYIPELHSELLPYSYQYSTARVNACRDKLRHRRHQRGP